MIHELGPRNKAIIAVQYCDQVHCQTEAILKQHRGLYGVVRLDEITQPHTAPLYSLEMSPYGFDLVRKMEERLKCPQAKRKKIICN